MARRAKSRIGWTGRAAAVLGAAFAGGVVALVAACLPELAPLPPNPAGDGAIASALGCGDGVIQDAETCDPGDGSSKGCVKCQIECAGGAIGENGHCYFAVGNEATYRNALLACRLQGAHVVTFASDQEVALVDGLVNRDLGYWVGLAQDSELSAYGPAQEGEPGFPQPPFTGPCPGCYGLDASGAVALPDSPLFDAGPARGCIVARASHWELVPCEVTPASFQTVCERAPVGRRTETCEGGVCFAISGSKKSYVVDPLERTGAEAAMACRERGGRVVVLGSREERESIARAIMEREPPEAVARGYWIGAVDDAGAWVWEDGEPVDGGKHPAPWGDNQGASSPGGRAYLRIVLGAYDTQLAISGGPSERHATICER